MKIFAISVVRDEEDVIGQTLEHLIGEGVDGIVIADNASTDKTRDVIEEVASQARAQKVPVVVVEDPELGHYQGRKMTALAQRAAAYGATWIVPFDADEIWCGLKALRGDLPPSAKVVAVPTYTYVETGYDLVEPSAFRSMQHRRPAPSTIPKICYQFDPTWKIADGNDGIWLADGAAAPVVKLKSELLRICHFPLRSPQQFYAKMAKGAEAFQEAPDIPENIGAHWRGYGRVIQRHGVEAFRHIYFAHYFCPEPWQWGLVKDPAPIKRVWS